METRLIIDVARLDPEGEEISGEVDAIDLEENLVHPFGGIRYRLRAQILGTELLVRGTLEQDFTLVCSRCGQEFDTTVKVGDFTQSWDVSAKTDELDITDDVRESVVLELPNYPLCDEACKGVAEQAAAPQGDARWGALDALGTNLTDKAPKGRKTSKKKE